MEREPHKRMTSQPQRAVVHPMESVINARQMRLRKLEQCTVMSSLPPMGFVALVWCSKRLRPRDSRAFLSLYVWGFTIVLSKCLFSFFQERWNG